MPTIIFVSGESAVGKTTFIRRKYSDSSQYFFLNLHHYTHHFALHRDEDAGLAAALAEMHWEAVQAMMDEKNLIIELQGTGMQQEVLELLEKAKKANIPTEWIQLNLPEEERGIRLEKAAKETHYHSSELYFWENLKVLGDILDNLCLEIQIHNLGTLSQGNKSICLMQRIQPEHRNLYFFIDGEADYFMLDVDLEEKAMDEDELPCITTYIRLDQMIQHALEAINHKGLKVGLEESELKANISQLIYLNIASSLGGCSNEKGFLN